MFGKPLLLLLWHAVPSKVLTNVKMESVALAHAALSI